MFTFCPSSGGGIILVARPSASTGTITNAGNAYDLPAGRPDDAPYTTYASKATVTGSAVAGLVDYDTVEYNTFPSRSKTTFTMCELYIGVSSIITCQTLVGADAAQTYVTAALDVQYQIDGTNWVSLANYYGGTSYLWSLGAAADNVSGWNTFAPALIPGDIVTRTFPTGTLSIKLPATSFPSNLNSLKVRFRLGTCKSNINTSYNSSGSYNVWDIRANIS